MEKGVTGLKPQFQIKLYHYRPAKDVFGLITYNIIIIFIFYIVFTMIRSFLAHTDPNINYFWTKVIYLAFILLFDVISGIRIFSNTKRVLQITPTEVVYTSGIFMKYRSTIPVCKIESCEICSSVTQRFFGGSSLYIYATGDVSEIYSFNIENGEDAYKTIMDLIR